MRSDSLCADLQITERTGIKMEINGYTRVCGLMGDPVEHTMSPVIHNTLSERLGKNLAYVPFHVPPGHVREAVEGAFALNLLGMNVTVPYKSQVIPFLKEIDPLAEQIGAVNTLVRMEDGYKGYNTDMPGLYRAMCEDGVEIAGEKVLILGAGGVARAVAMLLARKSAAKIWLLNRSVDRAVAVAEEVNGIAGRDLVKAMPLADHPRLAGEEKYLAIQATNVGMFPHVEDVVIEDEAFYQKVHTGYDLIFNPSETRFMQKVRNSGGRAFGGMKMLLYQGIIAYELWTGAQVEQELAAEIYGRLTETMKSHCSRE
ncbi:MAG: shikimate dehydrogenase [Lachnospiraceae bacterium]|nr:shikimate dehydrogenase [Lachnospiraceae bacterium]MCM1240914.1 shikimate dehydrogenase [Lachnospiraceae bacterium]